jgi:hypothetical protein
MTLSITAEYHVIHPNEDRKGRHFDRTICYRSSRILTFSKNVSSSALA